MQHNRRTPHHSTTNKKRPAQGLRKGEYQRTVKRTAHALKLIKTGDPDRRLVRTPGATARRGSAHSSRESTTRQQPKSTGATAHLNALTACAVVLSELGHSQRKISGTESHHACAPALPIRSRNDARREHCKHVEQRSSRRRNRSRSVFFADSKSALADASSAAICATTSRHSAFGPSLVAPSLRRRSIFKISACNLRANSPAFTLARRASSRCTASATTGRSKRANREMIARFMRHLSAAQRPTGGGF
jgi:hypothetical protein